MPVIDTEMSQPVRPIACRPANAGFVDVVLNHKNGRIAKVAEGCRTQQHCSSNPGVPPATATEQMAR
jgi:hypothetical protein